MIDWIKARLAEPSTRLGLGALAVALGTYLQTGNWNWQTAITAIAGALGAITPEKS